MNELYQLVAFDKNDIEYVIELNNVNKNNKGTLEFIDSGTVRFRNTENLAEHLFNEGKIPTKDVIFSIKYRHNGARYLPVIYNDRELYNVFTSKELDAFIIFRDAVLKRLEAALSKKSFYKYFIEKNYYNTKVKTNGHFIDMKLAKDINEYYSEYIMTGDIDSNRSLLQYKILQELQNYKQLRTIYMYYNEYMRNEKEIVQSQLFEKYGMESPIPEDYEHIPDIPSDIYEAYVNGGMDEVYSIVDGDDIFDKGIKFR